MSIINLRQPTTNFQINNQKIYRDGIELEKGVVLTSEKLNKIKGALFKLIRIFSVYPDLYLDIITPKNSNFKLFFYQRILLRSFMRYTTIYITATRAAAKTFLAILAKYLQCMFVPGHIGSIVAPNKTQAAKIAKQKIYEIWRIWPLLKKEVDTANFGKDYTDLMFKNGSRLSIVGALDSDRGIRTHSTLIDEVRDQDGQMIAEVILPQMNVSRRNINGDVNPYEKINTQVIYATSAGMKSSFAYEALIDTLEMAVIDPKRNLVLGFDYRIPVLHKLIDPNYVKKLKLSSSYDEITFASEYLAQWIGGSEESWFDFTKLQKYRRIKNPEWKQKYIGEKGVFYIISVDVGRLHDQTVICVFRVNIKDLKYCTTLVNIDVIGRTKESKTFTAQAIEIKKYIDRYNPKEVVIDINGLGIGLADEMIKEQVDIDGNKWPSYGFINDDNYKKIQPKDAPLVLYGIKASSSLKSKINGNAYSRLHSGLVRFLISEQEAKSALLATKTGQKMPFEKRIKRLLPHEITTKLFEEMAR